MRTRQISTFPAIPIIASTRAILIYLIITLLLLAADFLCDNITLPVQIDNFASGTFLHVGSQTFLLGQIGTPAALRFDPRNPLIHEYQLDGTDHTNNNTLDVEYLQRISRSPIYGLFAWMRDLNGLSRWRNLHIWTNQTTKQIETPSDQTTFQLPRATPLHISLQLQRPEIPVTLIITTEESDEINITIDRNSRVIQVTRDRTGMMTETLISAYFPMDAVPFAAMVLDTLIRTTLCAELLLFFVVLLETVFLALRLSWRWSPSPWVVAQFIALWPPNVGGKGTERNKLRDYPRWKAITRGKASTQEKAVTQEKTSTWGKAIAREKVSTREKAVTREKAITQGKTSTWGKAIRSIWANIFTRLSTIYRSLTTALHPIALLALVLSFVFVAWIAAVQYHGEPHIYDASAYLFAAKMYAQGHLWVPVPADARNFPGPFMIQYNGRWFGQYAPGTSLTLVPGIWLGVPWLVESVLGTLALLGTGLIAARLYDRRVATLTVLLGTLSPFYSYLAASYLSHAVALFYLVWGLWALLRFAQGASWWNPPVAALCFGMAALTRDASLIFIVLVVPGVLLLHREQIRQDWLRWLVPGSLALLITLLFVSFSLDFNLLLTGDPLIAPRLLFSPVDHWGFGERVGFYGQHTLAAGLVNLDQLLTILAIDLFGWPFLCTLAFLLIPFITRRAILYDWCALICLVVLTVIWVGYFYHGIYLGPRYLFETLPFLLILTSRGILTMLATAHNWVAWLQKRFSAATTERARPVRSGIGTVALLTLLMAYNLGYFLPRQIAVHTNFTGLPAGTQLDLNAIYHPPLHRAIILTDNYAIYQMVLFPLNDPFLKNDVLYAFSDTDGDLATLRAAYPGRTLYSLEIASDGGVTYVPH